MFIREEKQLAQLLREAAAAHHSFAATLGHPDESWPDWYARHIAATIQAGDRQACRTITAEPSLSLLFAPPGPSPVPRVGHKCKRVGYSRPGAMIRAVAVVA